MSTAGTTRAGVGSDPTLAMTVGAPGEGGPGAEPGAAGGDALAGLELSADGSGRSRVSGSTMLVAGALVIAGGVLWAMRHVSIGARASIAALAFDKDLVEAANRPTRDHRGLLADLNASRVQGQVPDSQVKKNPFRLNPAVVALSVGDGDGADSRASGAAREEAERLRALGAERARQVATALAGLRVNGLIGGSVPMARINGRAFRLGESIAGLFTIKSIHGRTVELECDGAVHTLTMVGGDSETGE